MGGRERERYKIIKEEKMKKNIWLILIAILLIFFITGMMFEANCESNQKRINDYSYICSGFGLKVKKHLWNNAISHINQRETNWLGKEDRNGK